MKITTTTSTDRLSSIIKGPTVTILNVHEQILQDEEGRTYRTYDQYRLGPGEYELVASGIVPGGIAWDDVLRSIERGALYDEADRMIPKYGTDVPDTAKRDAWIAYKAAVRATQLAEQYPLVVTYPVRPE